MVLLQRLRQLLLLPLLVAQAREAPYTSHDDVSWAITRPDHLAYPYHQALYNDFMEACRIASGGSCQEGENSRLRMNKRQPNGVYNYTQTGFTKIKTPEKLFKVLIDFWHTHKGKEKIEWKDVNPYHNMWESPPWFLSLEDKELGGGDAMQKMVWRLARPVLEEWTGMRLSPVSMYGVRIYKNNSILAPHVDRMPLVTSCIINLDQDLDEDWPLEVFDHDGNAHNVTMEPGDMVLYESHSVIHGRPFPMKGRAFVNVFLHFQPIGPLDKGVEESGGHENGLPPYVIPGGTWEKTYLRENIRWVVPMNVPSAVHRGDIRSLEYQAINYPHRLLKRDSNGWRPIHEAVYSGDLENVQFLMENGATVHDRIGRDNDGPNCVELARESPNVDEGHPVMEYLLSLAEGAEL